jgi:hypothetical protein
VSSNRERHQRNLRPPGSSISNTFTDAANRDSATAMAPTKPEDTRSAAFIRRGGNQYIQPTPLIPHERACDLRLRPALFLAFISPHRQACHPTDPPRSPSFIIPTATRCVRTSRGVRLVNCFTRRFSLRRRRRRSLWR